MGIFILYLVYFYLLVRATKITRPAINKKTVPNIIYGNKNKNHESLDHPK